MTTNEIAGRGKALLPKEKEKIMRNQEKHRKLILGLVVTLFALTGWFSPSGQALGQTKRGTDHVMHTTKVNADLVNEPEEAVKANDGRTHESQTLGANDSDGTEPFVGMWDVTVNGFATYYYTYSISHGSFVATGNIDNNWDGLGSSFGPTTGSYVRVGRRSYRIREKAWSFDPQGNAAGHSVFVGTYTVVGDSLSGHGTYTLYDLSGNVIFTEPLTVTGTKLRP